MEATLQYFPVVLIQSINLEIRKMFRLLVGFFLNTQVTTRNAIIFRTGYKIGTCGLIFFRTESTVSLACVFSGGREFLSSVGDPARSSCCTWEGEVGSGSDSVSLSSGTGSSFLCMTDLAYC